MTHTMSAAPEISRLTHAVASAAPAASSWSATWNYTSALQSLLTVGNRLARQLACRKNPVRGLLRNEDE